MTQAPSATEPTVEPGQVARGELVEPGARLLTLRFRGKLPGDGRLAGEIRMGAQQFQLLVRPGLACFLPHLAEGTARL